MQTMEETQPERQKDNKIQEKSCFTRAPNFFELFQIFIIRKSSFLLFFYLEGTRQITFAPYFWKKKLGRSQASQERACQVPYPPH